MSIPDTEKREDELRKELRQLDAEYSLASDVRKSQIDLRRAEINREYEFLVRERAR